MAILQNDPALPQPVGAWDDTDRLAVDTIRCLALDAVERAKSGHPGLPLGVAPLTYVLFSRFLRFDAAYPTWPNRDRFVLSAGHGSALLYALLHLYGYDVAIEDLQQFRRWNSKTPGHPEHGRPVGAEATTGPLGQGLANAVGMAIAERMLANAFNRPPHDLVDHRTFVLASDGDLMEGVALEAISLAGHLKLGKLICLYDSNLISLDGPTWQAFTEDVCARTEAAGWHVLRVENGDTDLDAIAAAIQAGVDETERPTLIEVRTTIGFGSPGKSGTSAAHGAPLGAEETRLTKHALGWAYDAPFSVPTVARERFRERRLAGVRLHAQWQERFDRYAAAFPMLATEWHRRMRGELPDRWDAGLPSFQAGSSIATRQAGGSCVHAIADVLPEFVGGDADLSVSTNTRITAAGDFDAASGAGRNIRFGVREHAMGAICNGIAYHGGLRPYAATFFCFSDYMRPAVRLAALSGLPVVYVWTHDSIGLGEDGPTHQPIEHLASLRAIPNLVVIRPADANETAVAWRVAVERRTGPTALVLTRQGVPVLDAAAVGDRPARGAYIVAEAFAEAPQAIIMASGSELHIALQAHAQLQAQGLAVRVVSFPSWELFEQQPRGYRNFVLPASVRARVAIEAGATLGWERYVGECGRVIGLDRFGASAPAPKLYEELGLTREAVVEAVAAMLRQPAEARVS